MWFVAAMLLSAVVLAALAGFHTGPHTHLGAAVIGAIAAAWLVVMAVDGTTRAPLLFGLLAADLAISGAVGVAAWAGLTDRTHHAGALGHGAHAIVGAMGTAVDSLDPTGVVRVKGENWSATSMNGTVPAGGAVQVVNVDGIRLEVWGEDALTDTDAEPDAVSPFAALHEALEPLPGEMSPSTSQPPDNGVPESTDVIKDRSTSDSESGGSGQ